MSPQGHPGRYTEASSTCGIRILGSISSWQQNLAGKSHSTCFTGIKDAIVAGAGIMETYVKIPEDS